MIIAPGMQQIFDALRERATALERENKILREELALLRQHMFGRRSERIEPGQLGLFADAGLEQAAKQAATTLAKEPRRGREPKGHGRAAFPAW